MSASIPEGSGRVFISYRREDNDYVAAWLYERLIEEIGADQVFKDVDSIEPGVDFVQAITAALGSCDVVLAVIGRHWLTAAGGSGQRRIDDPMDFVRMEIKTALASGVTIIPVLIDGARMPEADDLPPDLEQLARRNAFELSSARFTPDTYRLLAAIPGVRTARSLTSAPGARPAIDAATLSALNPGEAARRLVLLSLDDAALVLVDAPVSAAAEVLEVLLSDEAGQRFAVTILAHVHRNKAEELIAGIPSGPPWLGLLPAAAHAILRWKPEPDLDIGAPAGSLAHAAPSPLGTEGYYRSFRNGQIHWTEAAGALATVGEIAKYHVGKKGSHGRLGYPLTPQLNAAESPSGTTGTFQRFEGKQYYGADVAAVIGRCGATVYWSEKYGAHGTWGSIGACYERQELGTLGRLGFPVTDEFPVGPSSKLAGSTSGVCQRFEGGAIYYSEKTRAVVVYEPIAEYLESRGSVAGSCGFPVSLRLEAAKSPYQTTGYYQRFQGTELYPRDISENWTDQEQAGGATIYTSEAHGTYCVGWGNGVYYERLYGTSSWLGFPKSDETVATWSEGEQRATIQEFEGGAIFYKEGLGSLGIRGAILDYLAQHSLTERIGFPVGRRRSLSVENAKIDEQAQFFEHGVVTIRNGVIEAWLRPEKPPAPS